ncbi:energy-coupling factor transporter transmembrane protein EcfT [Candidatus Microgenomates bacterium]|nr:MAG: energy-coupling factor transporter transmembrane protein EcfT [Candidatus Microgenomates bacterium]
MGNSRFVETMRNIRIEKWSTATELFTYLLGQSLLTVPSVGLEVSRLQEIQRARGIDTTGSVVQKAKKAVGLAIPLFEAMLDRIRYQGLSHEVLGYDPFAKRTVYNQLHFTRVDWLVLGFMLVLSILAFTLKL